jgi:hypothetical protein
MPPRVGICLARPPSEASRPTRAYRSCWELDSTIHPVHLNRFSPAIWRLGKLIWAREVWRGGVLFVFAYLGLRAL